MKVTRKVNYKNWLQDVCRLMAFAFGYIAIIRMAVAIGVLNDVFLNIIGGFGGVGYLFISGYRLLERDNPAYWTYTETAEE